MNDTELEFKLIVNGFLSKPIKGKPNKDEVELTIFLSKRQLQNLVERVVEVIEDDI